MKSIFLSILLADIPTTLIEAFRATLNDAIDAHLVIHVCDISHPDHVVQRKIVMQTLAELDVPTSKLESMITVFNKSDLLNQQTSENEQNKDSDGDGDDEDDIEDATDSNSQKPIPEIEINNKDGLTISCKTGEGLDQLIDLVQKKLMIASSRVTSKYRVLQGGQLYQALANGDFCTIENMTVDEEDQQFIQLKCLFSKAAFAKFQARFPGASKYQISTDG